MPNKLDKFGLKLWVLADVETKYCFSLMPYLSCDNSRVAHSLGTHVVMKLMGPLFEKGSTESFFTSKELAEALLTKRTTLTGTVLANHREFTGINAQLEGKKKPDTVLFYNTNKVDVDVLDFMCRQLSTRAACRRWLLVVFCNILDLAGVNAFVLFRKSTGRRISRRHSCFNSPSMM